ncbi:hypothetical protein OSH11_11930 [Kaistia dalseonensis]|uniref:Uncharacterized protein n=1 Tax=Kaistia dalseonensis TaxID=410840 RepID=A0ABU0H6R6_9HYPH|nr:hypothetical protein [Kaistia dalseonensis]MCX5495418.1 hypothetical protein [Kaistia dalseonensis]MDQ0438008.1 hypothetical protein [Kaistia dalseonensis]
MSDLLGDYVAMLEVEEERIGHPPTVADMISGWKAERTARQEAEAKLAAAENERDTTATDNFDRILDLGKELAEAEAEIVRLREALKPFAAEAAEWGDGVPDDHRPVFVEMGHWDARYYGSAAKFTVGDQRRARAALSEPKP